MREQTTIRLPEELLEELKREADRKEDNKKPTFNEFRKEHGLGPVEGGDVVLTKG